MTALRLERAQRIPRRDVDAARGVDRDALGPGLCVRGERASKVLISGGSAVMPRRPRPNAFEYEGPRTDATHLAQAGDMSPRHSGSRGSLGGRRPRRVEDDALAAVEQGPGL